LSAAASLLTTPDAAVANPTASSSNNTNAVMTLTVRTARLSALYSLPGLGLAWPGLVWPWSWYCCRATHSDNDDAWFYSVLRASESIRRRAAFSNLMPVDRHWCVVMTSGVPCTGIWLPGSLCGCETVTAVTVGVTGLSVVTKVKASRQPLGGAKTSLKSRKYDAWKMSFLTT
jgi:hypothetical protein